MATRADFAKFMGALSRAIPRFAPRLDDAALLDVWFTQIGHLSLGELQHVMKDAVRTLDQFPSIREILAIVGQNKPNDDDIARDVGERIFTALSKYGSQMTRWPAIEALIGPVGLEVVRLQGGWQNICDVTTNDNAPTLKAQWRELAGVLVRKARHGDINAAPDFEVGPRPEVRELAAKFSVVKDFEH